MSYVFMWLFGKGEDELKKILAEIDKKLEKNPNDPTLLAEKEEVENALKELK